MFGIQAANIGGVSACMAKVAETVCSMMYPKLRASPIPRYSPIPPFLFLEDSDTPIVVRINDAKEVAIRLWYSTSYCTTLLEPLSICLLMYSFSCGLVNVSCCPFEKTRSVGSIIITESFCMPLVMCSLRPFSCLILQLDSFQ